MNTVVMFFSRTGNSRQIANRINNKIQCEIVEITDDKSWDGVIGFIKGGYYSLKWKKTNTTVEPDIKISDYDNVILISPVWAGNVAPAVYSYLFKEKKNIKKLYLLVNNNDSNTEVVFEKLEEKLGKIENKFSITKDKKNEDDVIKSLIETIQKKK